MSDLSKRCRLCLNITKHQINFNDNNELLSKMLICLPVVLYSEELNISNHICTQCAMKVNEFYQFWRVVAHNNEFFKLTEETPSDSTHTNLITSMHSYSKNPEDSADLICNKTDTNTHDVNNKKSLLNGDLNSSILTDIKSPNINYENSAISTNPFDTKTAKSDDDDDITVIGFIKNNSNNNNLS